MLISIDVNDETTADQLDECIATLTALAKRRRKRSVAPEAPKEPTRFEPLPAKPVAARAQIPTAPLPSTTPTVDHADNRTAVPRPAPFVPTSGAKPVPFVVPETTSAEYRHAPPLPGVPKPPLRAETGSDR